VRTLRRSNQLNHFLWAAEPVLNAIGFGPERFRRQLRGDPRFREAGVLGNESDFVDANPSRGVFPEIDLKAVGQRTRLRVIFHEHPNQIGEFVSLDTGLKSDARDAGSVEQVGKAPLSLCRFQRHPVEQQLRADAPSNSPAPPEARMASPSSFQVISNCAAERACSKP